MKRAQINEEGKLHEVFHLWCRNCSIGILSVGDMCAGGTHATGDALIVSGSAGMRVHCLVAFSTCCFISVHPGHNLLGGGAVSLGCWTERVLVVL